MQTIEIKDLNAYVNENIDKFHESKIRLLQALDLNGILKKKNPYLFKAKNLNSANDLVSEILNATLYSSEEELFGQFLEELAIYISTKTAGGGKSSATGIDLEFKEKDVHYLVSIKSGVNWGNSSQIKKQESDFQNAVKVLKQSNQTLNVQPVLGICYGKTRTSFLRGYMKVVGQTFWHLISGDEDLFVKIIEPLGYNARAHNESFIKEKNRVLNIFTQEFVNEYCDDGIINWERLIRFNSGNLSLPPKEATMEEEVKETEPQTVEQ